MLMKCIICSETCTIEASEKWRNIRTKSPRLFSLHTKIHGKKMKVGLKFSSDFDNLHDQSKMSAPESKWNENPAEAS